MGLKFHTWTKELDDRLLIEIAKGKNATQLENAMSMSYMSILKRLKEMGFDGLRDARDIMSS
jgi:hypothetical protein